ncbi:MAG: hypothetical protein AAFO17_13330 [Pseudomonadota bacterium]
MATATAMAMAMAMAKAPRKMPQPETAHKSSLKSAINWTRLISAIAVGALLVGLLGAQALSSVASKKNPDLAISVWPINGTARGHHAFEIMTASDGVNDGVPVPTEEALVEAKTALANDPLVPKAHIVIALSQRNAAERQRILELASGLNRRDLALQGLVLQEAIEDGSYEQTVAALDRILRVHPGYSREFFPLLVQALNNNQTIETFAVLLDGSSPWHSRFLNYASRQATALPNLGQLRPRLDFEQDGFDQNALELFDRRLIAGLARSGDLDASIDLYRNISGTESDGTGQLTWTSDYPPLEWRFVDEAGFRAQSTSDGQGIEIAVRPGKGGTFAERIVQAPPSPFTIDLDYTVTPKDRARDLRMLLSCADTPNPFFDENFKAQAKRFVVDSTPSNCEYIRLALTARAWSGRSKLNIEMRSITIQSVRSGS